jgi:anti-sigma regulatory factor (Ser/Thr protein kinase)
LRFDSDAASLPVVRAFVLTTLRAWRASEPALDDAVLVANELVANAIVHAGTSAEIVLERRGIDLVVRVCDGTTSAPQLRASTPSSVGGRGLVVLDAVATEWGVEVVDAGKEVWARFDGMFTQ